jgi:hypothetical protein
VKATPIKATTPVSAPPQAYRNTFPAEAFFGANTHAHNFILLRLDDG